MGIHIANRVIKLMTQNDLPINKADVLVLGITFKENCPDIRNSRVVDVIREMQSFGTNVDVFDPLADADEVYHEYKLRLTTSMEKKYHAIILAVGHLEFSKLDWSSLKQDRTVVYDVKGILDDGLFTARL
jgi:UDP-N-acetyl-D-galactosamine dehydrogenase